MGLGGTTRRPGGDHTTCYIVAYDIPDDRRRTRVHKLLCGFGAWTQFSLFECFLTKRERVLLRAKLDKLLDPTADHVRFYPLCASCVARVETVGGAPPEEEVAFIL